MKRNPTRLYPILQSATEFATNFGMFSTLNAELFAGSLFVSSWVPVITAWLVLSLWTEERLQDMEGSCEYNE